MGIENTIQKIMEEKKLSREEIKNLIDKQIEDFSGLIDEEGAIVIVAKELGIDVKAHQESAKMESDQLITNLKPRMNASIVGRIVEISEVKTFNKKDGSKGSLLPFILEDTSGMIRCLAWDDFNTQIITDNNFRLNEIVRIVNGFVKQSQVGSLEIHIGSKSRIQTQPDEVDRTLIPAINHSETKITPINQLSLKKLTLSIEGVITTLYPTKKFTRKNGTEGKRASLQISDSTGLTYLTFWGDHCEMIKDIKEDQKVRITKLSPKSNYRDKTKIDLTATSNTKITIIEEETHLENSIKSIENLLEIGGFGNIEGIIQEIGDQKSIQLKNGESTKLQKMVLADETGEIIVTIWGDKINPDLKVDDSILIKKALVKINSYSNEMEASLSTRGSIERSEKTFNIGERSKTLERTPPNSTTERKKIEDINQDDFYEFKGSIIQEIKRIFFYIACSKCNRKIDNCKCDQQGDHVNRMILNLILDDESSTIRGTMMTKNAELLLNESTDNIKKMEENGELEEFLKNKSLELIGKEFIFSGKAKFSEYNDNYEINIARFKELDSELEAQNIIDILDDI
ncbi:DUF2240 family protein [Promethearchaeum syntrophicum]|uniref:DUF2240 family protein n=1 Tax=Promethearchaeum syntrophicum TaxID=2594042 RepID=A0A5B9D782_9ARCH|nr:DUF2240 family protein [Candidatus Prometheoarchaeum syntrophicum]QEE14841.1 Replication factor A [Candidatus Prometheoarchaeum syntrophicum]